MAGIKNPEVSAYIARWLEGERTKRRTWEELAEEIGVTKQQLMGIAKGTIGAGEKTERAFAKSKFGGSVDSLRLAAEGPIQTEPERIVEYDKLVYTNLVPVLASLRANGELPGVLAGLEAERLAPDAAGHDEDYWWKRAAHYRAKLKGASVQHATEDNETFGFVPGSGPKK